MTAPVKPIQVTLQIKEPLTGSRLERAEQLTAKFDTIRSKFVGAIVLDVDSISTSAQTIEALVVPEMYDEVVARLATWNIRVDRLVLVDPT